MKPVITVLLGLLASVLGLTMSTFANPKLFAIHETSKPIPNLKFQDESGQQLSIENYKGKFVLLNIWATWCAPCRKEMPTLDRLQNRLGGNRFEVVALSIDRAGARAVRKFYDEIGVKYLKLVVDQRMQAMRNIRIVGLPTTLLLDQQGREIGRLVGPAEWDTPEMVAFFQSQIAKTDP